MAFSFISAVLLALASATCLAQQYPSKPIRAIVPFPPGGSADVAARLISQEVSRTFSQPVVVDNRAGVAGNLGAEVVAKAAPDGYTFLYGIGSVITTNPWLYKDMRFDPMKDLMPVRLTNAGGGFILVAPSQAPFNNLKEFLAYARKNPGKLNFGSYGSGSSVHLVMEMMKGQGKLYLTHIPYRGAAPAMTGLLGQQVDVMFDTLINSAPHIRSGKLKALAVSTAQRMPLLPDVPALSESFPGFEAEGWHGVFLPNGTPRDIALRLNDAVGKALATPELEKWLKDNGLKPGMLAMEDFATMVRTDHARWGKVVRDGQITPD